MINQVETSKQAPQAGAAQTSQNDNKGTNIESVFTSPLTKVGIGFGVTMGEKIKNAYETGDEMTNGSIFASPILKFGLGAGKEFGETAVDIYEKGTEITGDNIFISPLAKFAVGLGKETGENIQDAYTKGDEICGDTNTGKADVAKVFTSGLVGGVAGFIKQLFA